MTAPRSADPTSPTSMSDDEIKPGPAIINWKLGEVVRQITSGKTKGDWLTRSPSGDPGATLEHPSWCPTSAIKPVIVGETVCKHAWGEHFCGFVHLTREQFRRLDLGEPVAVDS